MAGPQTIQRVPRGLLDWFGNKGTGATPSELTGTVVPIVDIGQLYLADVVNVYTTNTGNINLPGVWGVANNNATVPPGELWLLLNMSGTMPNLAAGDIYQFRLGIARAAWTANSLSPTVSSLGNGVGASPALGWQCERPEIMRPGDSPMAQVESCTTAAAKPITFKLYVARLLT